MRKRSSSFPLPHSCLLLIDVINGFDFPEGKSLKRFAKSAAQEILKLKKKWRKKNLPIIYVNDQFEHWQADWQEIYRLCAEEDQQGRDTTILLKPEKDDYVVLKPKHSGFYSTQLEVLLKELGIKSLVICGFAGNICVLFTANDAYMRGYEVFVPRNCIASNTKKDNDYVIRQLQDVFGIDTKER